MKAVIQRVTSASVMVDEKIIGEIGAGLLVLLGVANGDAETDLAYVLKKTIGLRIFSDEAGKMNRSIRDVGGSILVVSQFTLLGDVRGGNRPSFIGAAAPEIATAMYEEFVARVRTAGIHVETGKFAADMKVLLLNDGPVTILIDSASRK